MKNTAFSLFILLLAVGAYAADTVRLKNARELYAAYEATTGIDGRQADLAELYRLNMDRLPKYGLPEELSSSTVLAATEISGAYCKKAIDREKVLPEGERMLFADIDFTQGPSQFTSFLRETAIDRLAIMFWQRNATEAEIASLSETILSASMDGSKDLPAETEKVLQVLCTTVGTSLAFLTK